MYLKAEPEVIRKLAKREKLSAADLTISKGRGLFSDGTKVTAVSFRGIKFIDNLTKRFRALDAHGRSFDAPAHESCFLGDDP